MAKVSAINYFSDYQELRPSLFRESENLDSLIYSISEVQHKQQEQFLWLSENILNIDIAEKSHLDFIGNIVGQPRFLVDFNVESYFGFEYSYKGDTFGAKGLPFVGGIWNSRSNFNTATARQLTDEEYSRVIKARVIFNNSDCNSNDLLEVVNLLTNNTTATIQMLSHGTILIKVSDKIGLMPYFVDRLYSIDNILPIAAGVRVYLDVLEGNNNHTGIAKFALNVEKLANEDLPRATDGLMGSPLKIMETESPLITSFANETLPNTIESLDK